MKQILQNARTGDVELAEVPTPTPSRGQLLVRNRFSVMSPGTEKLALDFASSSLISKARSRPDLVRQVVRKMQLDGPMATYKTVTSRLDEPQVLGYSSAGIVEAVGPEVTLFKVGDRVACAGAGYASHSEFIVVPENLTVPVPESVSLDQAAFSTLGAIALQGVRVSEPTMGECGAVIGLGLLGQLTVQLLRANGCRTLGIDLDESRIEQARGLGLDWHGRPGDDFTPWKEQKANGHGADFAVVTASSDSSAPLALAANLCRHKGRISIVGAMPVEFDRRALYDKELEVRMSTSYGPGRYDRNYEELGLDYPLPYVRWTENRNMSSFLGLIESGHFDPRSLATEEIPFESAVEAYRDLGAGNRKSLAGVFRYSETPRTDRTLVLQREAEAAPRGQLTGVSFIGAGNYARGVLLPALAGEDGVQRISLVTVTGASALRSAQRFEFAACGTDPAAVLEDPNVEFVFVATRHDSHATLAIDALRAGKGVWLEKPLALTPEDADAVLETVRETSGFLVVGYNRRFSPHALAIHDRFSSRSGPLAIRYRIAAGPPPRGTWSVDPREGGGRVLGEVCHFVDLCTYLVGAPPATVYSRALGADPEGDDSNVSLLSYPDGSTATIEYLAHTSPQLPKELIEVSADGATATCDNFRRTRISGGVDKRTLSQDKGQAAGIAAALAAFRAGKPAPFTLEELASTSRVTFAMLESASRGEPVGIDAAEGS